MSFLSMLQMAKGKEQSAPPSSKSRPAPVSKPHQVNNLTTIKNGDLYSPSTKSGLGAFKPKAESRPTIATAPNSVAETPSTNSNPRPKIAAVSREPRSASVANSTSESTSTDFKKPLQLQCGLGAKKKLSFKDVLKQASSIDKSKLEMNLRVSNQRHEKAHRKPSGGNEPRSGSTKTEETHDSAWEGHSNPKQRSKLHSPRATTEAKVASKTAPGFTSAPFAQPFPELKARLEQKKRDRGKQKRSRFSAAHEDDLDDFVVSEDDAETGRDPHDLGGDIWSLYNRRPKGSYQDEYDSADEMEATGCDIFDEERRCAAQARREDVEEERKLEARANCKKLRRV